MWPFKTYVKYKVIFYKNGQLKFEFSTPQKKVNGFELIMFSLLVYSRLHSHYPKDRILEINSAVEELINTATPSNFEYFLKEECKKLQTDFKQWISKTQKVDEKYIFKLYGLNLSNSALYARFPGNYIVWNQYLLFFGLLILVSQRITQEGISLLLKCFKDLIKEEEFYNKNYSINRYDKIPIRILKDNGIY